MLGILQPGVDYSIGLSTDIDSGGTIARIRPLRPLVASTGGTNNGYLILVTNGVRSTSGAAATPDTEYLTVRTAAIADLTLDRWRKDFAVNVDAAFVGTKAAMAAMA